MRRIATLVTAFIIGAAFTILPLAQGASAQSPDCVRGLLAAPIETLPLPEDAYWGLLEADTKSGNGWEGYIVTAADEESAVTTFVGLHCVADPALAMRRMAEIDAALALKTKVEVVPIGDESYASQDENGWYQLFWRHEEILGNLSSSEELDVNHMEALATALDDLLP